MPVSHLQAYNLDWLAYLDPADVPPVKYATCIVDTGVAVTPDTPPDNPAGPIVKRLAVDGGSGEPQSTENPYLHGTRIAYAAVAPQNGWGTVGVWPGGTVIGVRGTADHSPSFHPGYYHAAIYECAEQAATGAVGAILLALNCGTTCDPDQVQRDRFAQSVSLAHAKGLPVVSSAGNGTEMALYPATELGVVAVTAGDDGGSICPGVATTGVTQLLVGPGCPVQNADPLTGTPQTFPAGGTSSASAVVAALLSFLRSARPLASREQLEEWVQSGARSERGVSVVDGAGAARAAGLEAVVQRARDRQAAPSAPEAALPPLPEPSSTPTVQGQTLPKRLAAPIDTRMRWRNGRLRVNLSRAVPRLRVVASRRNRARSTVRRGRRISWRLPFRPRHVILTALPLTQSMLRSRRVRFQRFNGRSFRQR